MEGRLNPARLRPLDISVNWSKYSKPWDVIFDHPGCGIARLLVKDVCKLLPVQEIANQTLKLVKYYVAHVPEDLNYSHSEIKVKKDEVVLVKSSQISDTAKKEFKQILSDRAIILLAAEIQKIENGD